MHIATHFAGLLTDDTAPVDSDEETEMSLASIIMQVWCLCTDARPVRVPKFL